ncbi:DUF488 domain-containing protein [Gracilimonas sp. BCB1]|uniref:DUF488 domain-containing protein n=1 Tax=Gracilimonas sp. BCB1 TaxID=3152362 RepID=UPI0032D94520
MEFFTIGVYNSTKEEYFGKLINNRIDTFCDIRQRRGVRGAKYKFVNSKRLQAHLKELGLNYHHIKSLAPTKEIRNLQKEADRKTGEKKRSRDRLGVVFIDAYQSKILEEYDFQALLSELENTGANRVALFCVEEKPEACHRSLVANRLYKMGYEITHL